MAKQRIAVVGATGMVGGAFLKVLEEYGMSDFDYTLLASEKSAGKAVAFLNQEYRIEPLNETSFDKGYDVALFSAGGSVSAKYAPIAAAQGAVVVDNSSFWRMDKEVPLVVPEVNPEDIKWNKGVIANPNCSTIQAVVALNPIHKKYGIKRIVYSTYQSVSGAGMSGWMELENGIRAYADNVPCDPAAFPHPIFNNCIPHIDAFLENGYTKEEIKMVNETRKILHDDSIAITATTVRVPVFSAHSESINLELSTPYDIDEIRALLADAPGVVLADDPKNNVYPLASIAAGRDDVFVGRIRRDESIENGLNLWVVSDNVRKGAASNAVQIAQIVLKNL